MTPPERRKASQGALILIEIMPAVASIHVNAIKKGKAGRGKHSLGKITFCDPQLDSDAAVGDDQRNVVPLTKDG
jgi:hypothetical protein